MRPALLAWFEKHRRDLPWRRTSDPYAIWLSEVMLQQTQVDRVIPYWERFLAALPTVRALAEAPEAQVLGLWSGLGYYSRARNLHRAAKAVVTEHGGELPRSVEALLELPGFGRYTAGAVASIAHGLAAPIVDGNVARVLSRLLEIDGVPQTPAREAQLWTAAEALVVGPAPGLLNQALMELGALICTPSSPTCLLCPVREHCGALAHGRVDELPPPKPRAARKALELAVAVVRQGDAVLLAEREAKGLFGGLWELPSAEATRAHAEALAALLGAGAKVGGHRLTLERTLTHRDLTLVVFDAAVRTLPKPAAPYRTFAWVRPSELSSKGLGSATQALLDRLVLPPQAVTVSDVASSSRRKRR